ncbi:Ankyrin repeat domain containing protein [Balamuthia mandrillaris]
MNSSSDNTSFLPPEIWYHILRDHLPDEWKGIATRTCTLFWSLLLANTKRGVKHKRGSNQPGAPALVTTPAPALAPVLAPTLPQLFMRACLSSLPLIQWARHNHCPWNKKVCVAAADRGHLEVLQWARANSCPWDRRVCMAASDRGHLALLQWARANGCPWDVWISVLAAKGGHLEVLQWACVNGCPWNIMLDKGIWACSAGLARMDVHGINGSVSQQLKKGIWTCSAGLMRMDAHRLPRLPSSRWAQHQLASNLVSFTIPYAKIQTSNLASKLSDVDGE